MSDADKSDTLEEPRRNFLLEFWSVVVGGAVGIFPALAGLAVILDPLRKSTGTAEAEMVRVTSLDAVPADGVPRQFPVIKDVVDAWTFSPDERVGAVYLLRQPGSDEVVAFNVVCPHAGCFVGFDSTSNCFLCPCHTSSFELDGSIIHPSPSPRDLDRLDGTEVKDGWVHVPFTNFLVGKHQKIPK